MGTINKGIIAGIEGNTARVLPSDADAKPTAKIVIPWHLRGDSGNLRKGTAVVYVEFDDTTGLLLGRADGEWGGYLPSLNADSMNGKKITTDNITAGNISATNDVSAGNISLKNHVHSGVETGGGNTEKPK